MEGKMILHGQVKPVGMAVGVGREVIQHAFQHLFSDIGICAVSKNNPEGEQVLCHHRIGCRDHIIGFLNRVADEAGGSMGGKAEHTVPVVKEIIKGIVTMVPGCQDIVLPTPGLEQGNTGLDHKGVIFQETHRSGFALPPGMEDLP